MCAGLSLFIICGPYLSVVVCVLYVYNLTVHLQDAFHEEVERLVKIDVLEKVTEPTEWVNSFVIVEKVIDSSNAHSPNHVIKKSIRLCIDPKDLNEA